MSGITFTADKVPLITSMMTSPLYSLIYTLNLFPRVLAFPSPGATERQKGKDPGNEVELLPLFPREETEEPKNATSRLITNY